MRFLCIIGASVCLVFGVPYFATRGTEAGGPVSHPAAAAPATQPAGVSSAELNRLIADLGAAEFRTRATATEQLFKIGPPALPAVDKAAKGEDPEVASRCQALAGRIREALLAADVGPALRLAVERLAQPGVRAIMQAKVIEPGLNEISVTVSKLSAAIRRDAQGIRLTITYSGDGDPKTETYSAVDERALKKERRAAFEFYDAIIRQMSGESRDLRDWFEHPAERT